MHFERKLSLLIKYFVQTGLWLSTLWLLLLSGHSAGQASLHQRWWRVPAVWAQSNGPSLSIPSTLTATVGSSVIVPINYVRNGNNITSMAFSVDFDESCLAFDPTDANGDLMPDAVQFKLAAQFKPSVSYNPNDTQGELDIVIADYAPPLATLPDTPALLAIAFTTRCTPTPGSGQFAPVRFATHPAPSFGNTVGLGVVGTTSDGGVEIQNPALPTATPTLMTTAPPTPTFVPTAPATPTPVTGPTLTPEPSMTPVGQAESGRLYLPLVAR